MTSKSQITWEEGSFLLNFEQSDLQRFSQAKAVALEIKAKQVVEEAAISRVEQQDLAWKVLLPDGKLVSSGRSAIRTGKGRERRKETARNASTLLVVQTRHSKARRRKRSSEEERS